MEYFNIAIDGPAGAGKSTIAKLAAEKLGFVYVDTGAMYRSMALYFIRQGISPEDEEAIARACSQVEVTIRYADGAQQVILNGEDVSGLIRSEEVGRMASATSVYGPVRQKLVQLQKQLAREADVIMDGRDIGTVVLPEADCKIFLTASDEARAARRCRELAQRGTPVAYEDVLSDMRRRDEKDRTRAAAPLRQAEDAVVLDTSELDFEDSAQALLRLIRESIGHEA